MSPVLYPSSDGSDLSRVRATGDDPLVMYLVAPRRFEGSVGSLLAEAGLATLRCAASFGERAEWASAFREWERWSLRKVCLRARPAELERARSLGCAAAGEVLCFPPRRRSAAEPELSRLQAHIGPPLRRGPGLVGPLPEGVMLMLICEELGMTAGKACAQVGHAVLLAAMLHDQAAVAAWREAGCPLAVGLVGEGCFERVKAELVVAGVRDAGLTQVRPGAETVLAVSPGEELPPWLLAAAWTIE